MPKIKTSWQQKLTGATSKTALQLGFQLHEAAAQTPQQWQLEFNLLAELPEQQILNDYEAGEERAIVHWIEVLKL